VALRADGRFAISGSNDNTSRVWDLCSGRTMCWLEQHPSSVTPVALSADGRRAVSGSDDNTLRVWDLKEGIEMLTFTTDAEMTASAVAHNNGTILAGDSFGRVHFLEARDYRCFIDRRELPVGEPLDTSLLRALRRSSVLVVLASPVSLDAKSHIPKEIRGFAQVKPEARRKIVPISIGNTIDTAGPECELRKARWTPGEASDDRMVSGLGSGVQSR
jgi:WD40 repeat protein